MRTKESEPKDLGCHAREFVADPSIYLNELIIVHTRSVTKIHVNLRTGQRISPSASDSSSDEILCISRFDYQLTCYKPGTDIVLWYRRLATFIIGIVSRDGARLHELNDASARIGKTLIKPGTIGNISWSNRVIGEGGKNKVLVEGEYQQPAVILCIEKGQSADDAVKKEVSIVNDVCDANHTFIKVYGVESDRDRIYFATEDCTMSLRHFIVSFRKTSQHLKDYDKLLKLIWEIVTALAWLHRQGISHGNLNLDCIFVDKYDRPKILVLSLSKDATGKYCFLDPK
uniref:Serine/threonine-protein kinase/endoribonuclease IRE1a n=1 Tax=Tanacetum cinerariifolium TaxID=118510 RepID=A0A699JXF3_TANCI|nr:serine/threonine-protein kinase/endoribonuclease IRE1a [Tanacetum cinerariifolium]